MDVGGLVWWIQEWFEEYNNQFEVFTWFPDRNSIKNLWDVRENKFDPWRARLATYRT